METAEVTAATFSSDRITKLVFPLRNHESFRANRKSPANTVCDLNALTACDLEGAAACFSNGLMAGSYVLVLASAWLDPAWGDNGSLEAISWWENWAWAAPFATVLMVVLLPLALSCWLVTSRWARHQAVR